MAPASPGERLRAYLDGLPSAAKALLANEFERARLRGEDLPGGEMVLAALRSSMRDTPEFEPGTEPPLRVEPAPRSDQAARLLFRPLEPFLIDDRLEAKTRARIMRASVAAIWTWVERDLKPAETRVFEAAVAAASAANDTEAVNYHCAKFLSIMIPAIEAKLSSTEAGEPTRKRLAAHLGDERVLDDATDIVRILPDIGALAYLPAKLPPLIKNLADDGLDNARALLDPIAVKRPSLLPFALALVQSRLAHRHQLVRLAVAAAESDDPTKIAANPYRHAVELVLADAELAVLGTAAALKANRPQNVGGLVKDFHDAARALRTDMNLSGDGPWQRRMAKLRGTLARLLSAEIEGVPGQIRRHLRGRHRDDMHVEQVTEDVVGEIETRLDLLTVCRNSASEIALNEITVRVFTEIQGYLDPRLTQLLESIRSAPETDRALKISQIEAGIRFSARIFGASYAQLLQKAAEVAIQSARNAGR
ncbi:hypothetical protein [Phreatobacter stygius]|uniref:Uncharacterized protein n=1 Tax=Phreatobacter stygius TaxID=1940610 RepID=A0A4D7AYX9_9HYPH|nr:hypothetical protein [Phreatobacter stygius]QCI66549.1 hypothetical protein E8M01_21340 [Phreatobacter stygius]